jgi:quinoprotein glucose dehydrogenase
MKRSRPIYFLTLVLLLTACGQARREEADWPFYGGNEEGNRYSTLNQINLANVQNLQVAWTYHSADTAEAGGKQDGSGRSHDYEIQCQPIVVHGILYGINARLKLFALDAATGMEHWRFDPFRDITPRYNRCRGVAYWENGNEKRILYVAGSSLYAVDAGTGLPVPGFGNKGLVSLFTGLDINHQVNSLYVTAT